MKHEDTAVRVVALKTDDDSGLATCGRPRPTLAWRLDAVRDGVRQKAYEAQRCAGPGFDNAVITTGRIAAAEPFGGEWPGAPLASREVAFCRVRVWTDQGISQWSETLRIEGGLFEAADWLARPVTPVDNVGKLEARAVPLVRHAFRLRGPVASARLFTTALGVHDCRINGSRIGDALFDPGWTAYGNRLLYSVHDVSSLLDAKGENVIAARIGDGWWRGNLTWIPRRAVYGETTAFLAQLEVTYVDGSREVIASNGGWKGSSGAALRADFYNGSTIDLAVDDAAWLMPGFDDTGWLQVATLPLPEGLQQRTHPPVREIMRLPVVPVARGDGRWLVDCGQNLTGYLRLSVTAQGAGRLLVRHAEVLEPDGALHLSALRTAKAEDEYRVVAGRFVLEPAFTWHGFRFAEIVVEGDVEIIEAEACVIASDLRRIGHFRCSDQRINRLYENVIWSQRGNFLSIPTDCPQRDERLGWTGDIQVFAQTACANFDSRAFLASWLVDLGAEQRADGNVPSVVPNVIEGHPYEFGGIGWADAATLVPWAVYEASGDAGVLARQIGSMRRWVDYGIGRLDADGVWTGDFHLGDWLDPGAPPGRPEEATTDRDYIASCYLAHSARTLARAAEVLGLAAEAGRYARLGDEVATATWRRWRDLALATQAGCALAIAFAIAPEEQRAAVGTRLAALVDASQGRIATGFLGTPLVLPALTATGQHAAAWRLLLNEQAPGWLYQVRNGATTMWERWDAILPDGSIHGGDMEVEDASSMISFNHYAYGCVGAWLYRSVAGIAPDPEGPGYRKIRFAPLPGGPLEWAEARIETPFGEAGITWRQCRGALVIELRIPPGATGTFVVPSGWTLAGGRNEIPLGSGLHQMTLQAAAA